MGLGSDGPMGGMESYHMNGSLGPGSMESISKFSPTWSSMTMSVWSITKFLHENHNESALHRTIREENYSLHCTVKQRNLSHTKSTFLFPGRLYFVKKVGSDVIQTTIQSSM